MLKRSIATLEIVFLPVLLATIAFFGQPQPLLAENVPSGAIASIFSFSGERPDNLGISDGKLADCPSTPNCVSSQSDDDTHHIDPLVYSSDDPAEALSRLAPIFRDTDNAEIIEESDNYLYAEFTTAIMGFVDDVEFFLDPESGVIHARSASRLGESDLGVNRKRIESIRERFDA